MSWIRQFAARRPRAVPIGRWLGVPVAVTPSWLLSVLVIALVGGPAVSTVIPGVTRVAAYLIAATLAVLLGLCVLAHELGHCVVARRYGAEVVRIQLFVLGGVSEIAGTARSAAEEAWVAAAGPAVSGILAGGFALAAMPLTVGTVPWLIAVQLAVANAVVAVFNLLPALPLDGGRVLRAVIWRGSGNSRVATTVAAAGGYLLAAALLVWSAARIADGGRGALLQAVIALATSAYLAAGARQEQVDAARSDWAPGVTLETLALPIVTMPPETPVELALASAAGRAVLLSGPDGATQAILDVELAAALAKNSPQAPSSRAGEPVRPDMVVLLDDALAAVSAQVRGVAAHNFLLIGEDGQPRGVLRRGDVPH